MACKGSNKLSNTCCQDIRKIFNLRVQTSSSKLLDTVSKKKQTQFRSLNVIISIIKTGNTRKRIVFFNIDVKLLWWKFIIIH